MHEYVLSSGGGTGGHLDLTGVTRMLDVREGPGTYSVLLIDRLLQLNAPVLDRAAVVWITDEILARHSCGGAYEGAGR